MKNEFWINRHYAYTENIKNNVFKMNNDIKILSNDLDELEDRIEKALKFIDEHAYNVVDTKNDINWYILRLDDTYDLINILKGVDKE